MLFRSASDGKGTPEGVLNRDEVVEFDAGLVATAAAAAMLELKAAGDGADGTGMFTAAAAAEGRPCAGCAISLDIN